MSQPFVRPSLYKGYRYPPEIISHGVWLYFRFAVSLRDVSELLLARVWRPIQMLRRLPLQRSILASIGFLDSTTTARRDGRFGCPLEHYGSRLTRRRLVVQNVIHEQVDCLSP
jgi:hypothetical protein